MLSIAVVRLCRTKSYFFSLLCFAFVLLILGCDWNSSNNNNNNNKNLNKCQLNWINRKSKIVTFLCIISMCGITLESSMHNRWLFFPQYFLLLRLADTVLFDKMVVNWTWYAVKGQEENKKKRKHTHGQLHSTKRNRIIVSFSSTFATFDGCYFMLENTLSDDVK